MQNALTFGMSANIAGRDAEPYTTGWESLNLPVIGVAVEWPQLEGMAYKTVLYCPTARTPTAPRCSCTRRTFLPIGMGEGVFNPFGVGDAPRRPGPVSSGGGGLVRRPTVEPCCRNRKSRRYRCRKRSRATLQARCEVTRSEACHRAVRLQASR